MGPLKHTMLQVGCFTRTALATLKRGQAREKGWGGGGGGGVKFKNLFHSAGESNVQGCSGELLALEAQVACDEAISAAEEVKKRQRESMESFAEEDSSGMATPNKRQRTK